NEPLASTFFLGVPTPPSSTLFPYTTLFRSGRGSRASAGPPRSPPARAGGAPAPPPEAPWRAAWCCRPSFPGRGRGAGRRPPTPRSEEHTSELQSRENLVCRLLLEKKKKTEG